MKNEKLKTEVAPVVPNNILIYRADDNRIRLEVKLEEKTIWLSQKQIGELYQKSKATISEHIKHIFEDGELDMDSVVRNFRTVQYKGDRQVERLTDHYNLDMIMAMNAAEKEYEKYCEVQKKEVNQLESDFDKVVKQLMGKKADQDTAPSTSGDTGEPPLTEEGEPTIP